MKFARSPRTDPPQVPAMLNRLGVNERVAVDRLIDDQAANKSAAKAAADTLTYDIQFGLTLRLGRICVLTV